MVGGVALHVRLLAVILPGYHTLDGILVVPYSTTYITAPIGCRDECLGGIDLRDSRVWGQGLDKGLEVGVVHFCGSSSTIRLLLA